MTTRRRFKNAKPLLAAFYWAASLAAAGFAGYLLFTTDLRLHRPAPPAAVQPPPSAPPVPEVRPIRYESPRNYLPAGEATHLFKRRQMLVTSGQEVHTLTYFLFSPPAQLARGKKLPLVLVLHDHSGAAEAARHLVSTAAQARHPSFVLVPVLPFGRRWAGDGAVSSVRLFSGRRREGLPGAVELVEHLVKQRPVDPQRIYVAGCGEGGTGAFGAARRHAQLFAAAVPINGGWPAGDARKMTRVPLWVLHGAQNETIDAGESRAVARYVRAYGGTAIYTEFPQVGDDCGAPQLYANTLWQWMFRQKKDAKKPGAAKAPG